jgi:hypothetical protein
VSLRTALHFRALPYAAAAAVASIPLPATLAAQSPSMMLAAGAAMPSGSMADRYGRGMQVHLGTYLGSADDRIRVRLDLAGSGFPVRRNGQWNPADLRSLGAVGNVIAGVRTGAFRPFMLTAIGAHRLWKLHGYENPYGITYSVGLGAGAHFTVKRVPLSTEIRWHVDLTDYAAEEFMPGIFVPVTLGVRF